MQKPRYALCDLLSYLIFLIVTVVGLVKGACQDLDAGACAVIKSKLPENFYIVIYTPRLF
jgi:hypothetical protein